MEIEPPKLTPEQIADLGFDLLISEQFNQFMEPDSEIGKFHHERTIYIRGLFREQGIIFEDHETEISP